MLQDLEPKGMLKGMEINKGGLPISHLMFADDIIIFFKVANQTTDKPSQTLQNFLGNVRSKDKLAPNQSW